MDYGYDDEIKQAILDVLDEGRDGLHVWVFDDCSLNNYSREKAMEHRVDFADKVLAKLHPPTALELAQTPEDVGQGDG